MAAAVALTERRIPVTVFESGPVPGGRARRVSTQGRELDNGQHILIGAYGELFRLMRTVGVPSDALLRTPLEIRYASGFLLRALPLPAPLGLAAGLVLAQGARLTQRIGALRFMSRMRAIGFRLHPDLTVAELLQREKQDGAIGHYLWRPLCVAALNTPVEQASANVFLATLRDTLNGAADASDLLLPRVDLSKLFPEPAAAWIAQHGGEVRLRAPVNDLESLKKQFRAVIVAVGPHQLKALLPKVDLEFSFQPIYTCYLQYPDSVALPFPMLGLADGMVQWVFDRGALLGERGRLACVISAQGDHQQLGQEELAERCHRELQKEKLVLEKPVWSQVIAEKRATIASTVGLRKPPLEADGAILAGDYTDPEYPPTLEAAVRSGVRAAARLG
jgi:squalene-associated FAD-dependent desaturase